MADANDTGVVQRKQKQTTKETNDEGDQGLTPLSLPGGRSAGDAPAPGEIEGEIIKIRKGDSIYQEGYGEGKVSLVYLEGLLAVGVFPGAEICYKRDSVVSAWFLADITPL